MLEQLIGKTYLVIDNGFVGSDWFLSFEKADNDNINVTQEQKDNKTVYKCTSWMENEKLYIRDINGDSLTKYTWMVQQDQCCMKLWVAGWGGEMSFKMVLHLSEYKAEDFNSGFCILF